MDIIALGQLVKSTRQEKGLSQGQISEALHIHPTTLVNIEKGRRRFGQSVLEKVLSYLDLMDVPEVKGFLLSFGEVSKAKSTAEPRKKQPSLKVKDAKESSLPASALTQDDILAHYAKLLEIRQAVGLSRFREMIRLADLQ